MRVLAPFSFTVAAFDDATVTLLTAVGGALALALLALVTTRNSKAAAASRKVADGKVHTLPNRGALLGDLPEMGRNSERLHEWLYETSLRFNGEPWNFYLPGIMNTTVLTTPELIEEVLTAQADIFIRGRATNEIVEDLTGRSLITADGERWYHQRKAVIKFFSARALRTCMLVHMRKNVGQLNAVLDSAAASGEPLTMMPLFQEFAMQTFAELALGVEMNIIGTSETHVFERAVREGSPVIMRRGTVPAFWWKLERWLNIGPERKLQAGMRALRAWLNKSFHDSLTAVKARHAALAAAGAAGAAGGRASAAADPANVDKSLVELFIEQVDEDKDGLNPEDLPELILSLVIGARGTSATSLTWFFLQLLRRPDVEAKIRDEMAASLPHAADDSYVTTEHMAKLVYLEAVIKETLRLYPALPLNQRIADADTVIGGSIPVKKGDNFFISAYTIARLPTVWGPDAAEFKPERWINPATGELLAHANTKFLTFSTGARTCLGMRLAMLELRVAIVNLLKRYRFELAAPNDMTHVLSTELIPKDPLVLRWTRNPLKPARAAAATA